MRISRFYRTSLYLQDQPFTEEEYDAFRERILIKLETMGLTDLRKHIVYENRWTPEDIQKLFIPSWSNLRYCLRS